MRIVLFVLLILWASQFSMQAQMYDIPNCASEEYYTINRGDTLIVNCEKLYIYTPVAQRQLLAFDIQRDSLLTLLKKNQTVKDSISLLKDSILARYDNIMKIQNTAYDTLRARFNKADNLVSRATKNTDKALGLITRMKVVSAVSGGIMGSVAGGVIGGRIENSEGFRFNPIGAIVGGVLGAAINVWLMNKL